MHEFSSFHSLGRATTANRKDRTANAIRMEMCVFGISRFADEHSASLLPSAKFLNHQ